MIRIDWRRAEKVFGTLLSALRDQQSPYDRAQPPQIDENLPRNMPRGGIEHARFLFTSCYWMRGGIQSDRAFRALAHVYEEDPRLFDPAPLVLGTHSPHILREVLARHRLAYRLNQISEFWMFNALKLYLFWESDPRKLFDGVDSFEQSCRRVIGDTWRDKKSSDNPNGFQGFREKMVSMLIYFLGYEDLIDPFMHPIPIDFHVLRMLSSHEIITWESGDENGNGMIPEKLAPSARELVERYCHRCDVDPFHLCDALWLFSRSFCARNPGNTVPIGGPALSAGDYWSARQTRAFEESCGQCPVSSTCVWNVPSGPYYIHGKLVRFRGRIKSPQGRLF